MPYSHIEEKLQPLLGGKVSVTGQKGGGNSIVYCVEGNSKKWAVKSYPPYALNQRDRLSAELAVYQFLNKHEMPCVPVLQNYSAEERWLIIDWIEGEIPQHYLLADVEKAIEFIKYIVNLNEKPEAKNLPLAAEACLSLSILLSQIRSRLTRLQAHVEDEPALQSFLEDEFIPALDKQEQTSKCIYESHGLDKDTELSPKKRSLIPADFGFHNTIRDPSGKLYFFDFDYFGWDDPVKLLSDVLWHPKMDLSAEQKACFINGLANIYSADKEFLPRFKALWPLFGIRWVLILLNEFIPDFWQNRQHAKVHANREQAKISQLQRAKALLQKTGYSYEIFTSASM